MKKTTTNRVDFQLTDDDIKKAIIDYVKKVDGMKIESENISLYGNDDEVYASVSINNPKIEEKEYKPSHS
jgi:hypothetical protein